MPKAKDRQKRGTKLKTKEVATIHALKELGDSKYAIAKKTGFAERTIDKYLRTADAYVDKGMREKIEKIKEGEIHDLAVLTVQARERLHEIAPRMNAIEAIALMDRSFQQRRLLEGNSTANLATIVKVVQEAHGTVVDITAAPVADSRPQHKPVDFEENLHAKA